MSTRSSTWWTPPKAPPPPPGDENGFQISARAAWWGPTISGGGAMWQYSKHPFDVTTSPELMVYLFARSQKDLSQQQIEPRGWFAIKPLPNGYPEGEMLVDIRGGPGKVRVKVSYLPQTVAGLDDRRLWRDVKLTHAKLALIEKFDTHRTYALATVQLDSANTVSDLEQASELASIRHPYVAPLKFAFATGSELSLLSPLPDGGYLLHHLQKERRFDVDIVRFYAAELILALEYLHDKHIICAVLEPAHILLDAYGHIAICDPAIYSQGLPVSGDVECTLPASLEYTAPEILAGHKATTGIDWWMLGVLLYEMLTGLPPFHHRDTEEQQHRIISQAVQLPRGLPSHASDILGALLLKDPMRRLGANGASEVKAHPFFYGLDWQRVHQRDYPTPFQHENASPVFILNSVEHDMKKYPERRLSQGEIYEYVSLEGFEFAGYPSFYWEYKGHVVTERENSDNNNAWGLTWNSSNSRLYFSNRLTGEELFVNSHSPIGHSTDQGHTATVAAPIEACGAADSLPSKEQLKNALKISLKEGHGRNVVEEIIKYGIDLNTSILHYNHVPDDTGIMFDYKEEIDVTPLEWATEHKRLDLVSLFLENGADANYTCWEAYGPALVRAVHRDARVVPLLVAKTNRIVCTRALCAAIDLQNNAIAETLLSSGVRCEFEEADLPIPRDPINRDKCDFPGPIGPVLEAHDFLAPLVRAVRLGNAGLVRLLLEHAADANIGYHCGSGHSLPLPHRRHSWKNGTVPTVVNFACGRAVQLAMELGHDEIVRLLIQSGADVRLPQPCRINQYHTCPPVARAVWLEVISRLEEFSANMK
ncbi:hypothetical protein G7054_g4421 [Neopestalotiopsis clavispora]|nr:hypothetical protein G7054_g4421 [Neopestalotiopsis clavispora]